MFCLPKAIRKCLFGIAILSHVNIQLCFGYFWSHSCISILGRCRASSQLLNTLFQCYKHWIPSDPQQVPMKWDQVTMAMLPPRPNDCIYVVEYGVCSACLIKTFLAR